MSTDNPHPLPNQEPSPGLEDWRVTVNRALNICKNANQHNATDGQLSPITPFLQGMICAASTAYSTEDGEKTAFAILDGIAVRFCDPLGVRPDDRPVLAAYKRHLESMGIKCGRAALAEIMAEW